MTKYMVFWEWDVSKLPEDAADRRECLLNVLKVTKEHLKYVPGDFGTFQEGRSGYRIVEGTEEDVAAMIWRYGPALKWEVHPILDVEQSIKIFEKMS